MKITAIDYYRLHSLGQFENERIGLHAEVDPETENIFDCFKDLKATELSLHQEGLLIEESKKAAEAAEPKEKEKQKYDLSKVKTEKTEGPSGFYQKATEQDSKDYRLLIEDLKAHDGKLTRDGLWIWLFSDGKTAGIKPSKK